MMLDLTLRCITCALTLVATQRDTRIDSDSILAFPALRPCVWSQNFGLELIIFACHKLMRRNARSSVNIVNQPLITAMYDIYQVYYL